MFLPCSACNTTTHDRLVPNDIRKRFNEQIFQDKLQNKTTTWPEIQNYARCRDVWKEEIKVVKERVVETEKKEIVVNVGEVEEIKANQRQENKIEVEYDERQKRFYISNPGLLNLRPPQVQFTQKYNNYRPPRPQNQFYRPRNPQIS